MEEFDLNRNIEWATNKLAELRHKINSFLDQMELSGLSEEERDEFENCVDEYEAYSQAKRGVIASSQMIESFNASMNVMLQASTKGDI